MKLNIAKESENEVETLIGKILKEYPDSNREDNTYLEMKTGIKGIENIGIVFYPKLLTYGFGSTEAITPWICVRLEIEDGLAEDSIRKLLRWMVSIFKNIGYFPFMDEDATAQHFSKDERKGWTKYSMFVNPDYPEGIWENHTL